MPCECGKGPTSEQCCGPFIAGDATPATAEELMRSRYTAYTRGDIDYVVSTHDPDTADRVDRKYAENWSKGAQWEGLEIVRTEDGGPDDDEGVVEFIARYTMEGHPVAHHEVSRFRKVDGKWYYRDGEMQKSKPVTREGPKLGRNDPCHCGSGKKFKKCHGAA